MQRAFVRTLLVTFAVFAAFFTFEAVFEWNRLGRPGLAALSWSEPNNWGNTKLIDLLSPIARAYNNILAMLLATIGLAIPLTANMHTPKLISLFLKDWINRAVLLVMSFGAANVLWVDYLVGPHFAPMWAIRLTVALVLLGWAVSIPYFFYVVRYLDPSEIVLRLRDSALRVIDRAADPDVDTEAFQDAMHDTLSQIGTIVVKSLDRSDRGVALEGVWAFKVIADRYGTVKDKLPARAFEVDRHDFVGLSSEAIAMLNETHTWFERMVLWQLHLCVRAALSKASDTVSSMTDATRVILEHAHRRGDTEARDMAMRAMNGFVRAAIQARNVHAVYDVFYQYRTLARDERDAPDLLRQIAHALPEYASACREAGLAFASHLATFDLGSITRRAYEAKSEVAAELLDATLAMPHRHGSDVVLLVVKAKVLLGGFFIEHGLEAEARATRESLADVSDELLTRAERDLLAARRTYFELTDRQVDFEFVEPDRRPHVSSFVTACIASSGEPTESAPHARAKAS